MIEVDLDLKPGLNKQKKKSEKLFNLFLYVLSSTPSMYLCQINTYISLISFFIHSLGDKRHFLDELFDFIVELFNVVGFD